MTKKIKNYVSFQKFMSFIYILIIVVPIILSIIYLPPLINSMMGPYKELLGGSSSTSIQDLLKSGGGQFDLNKIKDEVEKNIKKQ